MAQAIAETVFDVVYLSFTFGVGLRMIQGQKSRLTTLAGWMAVLLSLGDACHLIPRCYALWTTGLEANAALLGGGKWITSITMTIFYVILYHVWKERYGVRCKWLTGTIWTLAIARIGLCLLPQNDWFAYHQPMFYSILRNIPFAAMGILIIVIFARKIQETNDRIFRPMPLAIALSFGFYLPVVLWSDAVPLIGALMIPKTLTYVWVVVMCYRLYCEDRKIARA